MKFSVIVCAYNSSRTLKACLSAIRASNFRDYELIVVDDGSQDETAQIAEGFGASVKRLPQNVGRSQARNEGALTARGDFFIFIDSDIVIFPDTLKKIEKYFETRPEIDALTGLLSEEHPHGDFFSQYKNLYMHYFFKQLPERVDFLYGSLCAIRRSGFEPFSKDFPVAEDTELGRRLASKGRILFLAQDLEVIHWKKYTFRSWVRNDFLTAYWWVFVLLKSEGIKGLLPQKGRFAHAAPSQLLSLATLAGFFLILLFKPWLGPLGGNGLLFLIGCWLVLNLDFLSYLFHRRGFIFVLKGAAAAFLDDALRLAAVGSGIFVAVFGKFFRGQR